MPEPETPVLIVGGGIAGLTSALALAQHGVASLLVERHARASVHPRTRAILARSAEVYRALGLEEQIRALGAALPRARGSIQGPTMQAALDAAPPSPHAEQRAHARAAALAGVRDVSPTGTLHITLDVLELLLRDIARQRGVDVRFGTSLVDLAQDDDGVTAAVASPHGARDTVRAAYLIAADGARGSISSRLGVTATSSGPYSHMLNMLFHAELGEVVRGREFSICFIRTAEHHGMLAAINHTDRWVFHLFYDPDSGESPQRYPPERCVDVLRGVLGLADVDIQLKDVLPWQARIRVLDSFQRGRVLFVGDAAHEMPPWRGQGATSAVADAHNVAWKLAAVLAGTANPELLATYDAERRPLTDRIARESVLADNDLRWIAGIERSVPRMFGGSLPYRSSAVRAEHPDGQDATPSAPSLDELLLDGRPGTRVPHAWVQRQGRTISTLDLLDRGFAVLTGPAGHDWHDAGSAVARRLGVAMRTYQIGPGCDVDDPDGRWQASAGLAADGALLVRPDGIVAWRTRDEPDDPAGALQEATARILGRYAGHTP